VKLLLNDMKEFFEDDAAKLEEVSQLEKSVEAHLKETEAKEKEMYLKMFNDPKRTAASSK